MKKTNVDPRFLLPLLALPACGRSASGEGEARSATASAPVLASGALLSGGPTGWASVNDLDQDGTTGAGPIEPVTVTSFADFATAVAGDAPRYVRLDGAVSGSADVGSNKTIEGAAGAVLHGHLDLDGAVNVIVRNLAIVGYNCADARECKRGKDAVTLSGAAHHIWFDHCAISDGSDGNLDITDGSDYVTVSWTKFFYSSQRSGDHQFSSLIGSSDDATGDAGHLRITFYADWWADHVSERMPRVRFGKVHLFNNLYTSEGNQYCVGLGHDASILTENNVFVGVKNPIESEHHSNAESVIVSRGNAYESTAGETADKGSDVFVPPYPYRMLATSAVRAAVTEGAGPRGPAPR
jgi:pectate lyase